MSVDQRVVRDMGGRLVRSESHQRVATDTSAPATAVKHTEMQVVRDSGGRVLQTLSHEWVEPDAIASEHAAEPDHTGELEQLRAANNELLAERAMAYRNGYDAGFAAKIHLTMHDALMADEEVAGR